MFLCLMSRPDTESLFEEGMILFRIAGKIDPRLEPVPFSTQMYEKDTWIPLIYEIRERGEELKIS